MIYLIFSREGYDVLMESSPSADGMRLRVNDGVLTDPELEAWREQGVDIALLEPTVDPASEQEIVAAVEAVEAVFPEETLLVEYA